MPLLLWQLIDSMPPPRDYLQVFDFTKEGDMLKITHTQEVPAYRREYLLGAPVFVGKIYVIDDGSEDSDNAEELLKIANRSDSLLYVKHGGSIGEGFELVSEPCILAYHLNHYPWVSIMDTAVNMGYRSHCTSTCGLHIHVNRSAFGKTYTEQEDVIAVLPVGCAGLKTGTERNVNLVLSAIREAKKSEKITAELQLHSDQDFQYTSHRYFMYENTLTVPTIRAFW